VGFVVTKAPPGKKGRLFNCDEAQEKKGELHRMAQGTLKWFSAETGYGLISPDDGGRNLFVRRASLAAGSGPETLEKGAKVTYEVTQGRNGRRATNVTRVPS
jgi:CspA family cold shock protein